MIEVALKPCSANAVAAAASDAARVCSAYLRGSASGARHRGNRLRGRRTPTRHRRGMPARAAPAGGVGGPGGPGVGDGVAGEAWKPPWAPSTSGCWRGHGYPTGEQMPRLAAIAHQCAPARCWGSSPEVMSRLAGTLNRFTSMRERRGRIASRRVLDQLPTPAQIGATGAGGVDVNKALRPRGRRARAGPPHGFTRIQPCIGRRGCPSVGICRAFGARVDRQLRRPTHSSDQPGNTVQPYRVIGRVDDRWGRDRRRTRTPACISAGPIADSVL